MKKGTAIIAAGLALCITFGLAGCKSEEAVGTEATTAAATAAEDKTAQEPGNDTGVTEPPQTPETPVEDYLAAIPAQDLYMFQSGICDGEFPGNSEIKRIALSKVNYDMCWDVVYAVIDLEKGEAKYGLTDGVLSEPEDYQIYELTDEDIKAYRDALDSSLLKDEVEFGNGYWNIAVEYTDGTCYAYQFGNEGYMNNSPENIMINAFFDKMEKTDKIKNDFALKGY